jgi:hypothetical protein
MLIGFFGTSGSDSDMIQDLQTTIRPDLVLRKPKGAKGKIVGEGVKVFGCYGVTEPQHPNAPTP